MKQVLESQYVPRNSIIHFSYINTETVHVGTSAGNGKY